MRKAFWIVLLMVGFYGCVSMRKLPFNRYPYISEIRLVKSVKPSGNKLKILQYKKGIENKPVLYMVIKNAEGKNSVKIKLYRDRKLIKSYQIDFGEKGKYYKEVVLWNMLDTSGFGHYIVAVFLNGTFIISREFEVKNSEEKIPD